MNILKLARVKTGKNESNGVEEKSSNDEDGRRAVRGRGGILCLIDDDGGRHGGEGIRL